MNSFNKITKLADRFERTLFKYAQTIESQENGVQFEVLFYSIQHLLAATTDPNGNANCQRFKKRFIDKIEKDLPKLLPANAEFGIKGKAYIDIKVSSPNSGSIAAVVNIYADPAVDKDVSGPAIAMASAFIKKSAEDSYKAVMGREFSARAKELNDAGKFPTNAEKVDPQYSFPINISPKK